MRLHQLTESKQLNEVTYTKPEVQKSPKTGKFWAWVVDNKGVKQAFQGDTAEEAMQKLNSEVLDKHAANVKQASSTDASNSYNTWLTNDVVRNKAGVSNDAPEIWVKLEQGVLIISKIPIDGFRKAKVNPKYGAYGFSIKGSELQNLNLAPSNRYEVKLIDQSKDGTMSKFGVEHHSVYYNSYDKLPGGSIQHLPLMNIQQTKRNAQNEGIAEGDAPVDHDWYRKQQERQTRAKQKQQGVAEGSEQRWRVTVGNKSGTLSHTKTFTGTKQQAIKQAVTRFATSKNPVVTAELVKQDVAENYPKHQDLSGVSTDKLKAYLAKQAKQSVPGEGGQVKRVQAELQRREQGVAEGSLNEADSHAEVGLTGNQFHSSVRRIMQDLVEEYQDEVQASTSTPSAPDTSKFMAQRGGMIEYATKLNVHGGYYGGNTQYIDFIKIGGGLPTEVKQSLLRDFAADMEDQFDLTVAPGLHVKTTDGYTFFFPTPETGTNWGGFGFTVSKSKTQEGVTEGGFKNMYAEFSGYGNYMQGRAVNVFKTAGLEVVSKDYTEDDDIQTYVVKGDRQSIEKAGEFLERNPEQFGGYHFVKQGVSEEKQRLDAKCWDGYKKQGTKMKGDTRVNNCVPESIDADQKKAKQVPATEMPKKTSPVLGKAAKQHPFKGRAVGESQ